MQIPYVAYRVKRVLKAADGHAATTDIVATGAKAEAGPSGLAGGERYATRLDLAAPPATNTEQKMMGS